jgi:hypothetical protein
VKRDYLGKGPMAEAGRKLLEAERRQRLAEAEAIRQQISRIKALDHLAQRADQAARLLVEAALLEMGCYQHWRQWRMARKKKAAAAALPASKDTRTWTQDEFQAVFQRAKAGDREVMPQLRLMMRGYQDLVDRTTRDPNTTVREALVANTYSEDSLLAKECIIVRAERMAAGIAGPGATVLERLLAEQIATAWLHMHLLEMLTAQTIQGNIRIGQHFQRVLTLAQRRYLSAVGMLARVRKLAGSKLQVNLGAEQADIAGKPDTLPMPARRAALPPVSGTEEPRPCSTKR